MSELTPNLKLFKYNTETDAKQPFSINDCMNANWDKIDASLGSLEICDIGMALYVDETKGLRRYLNGQIVDRNANTEAFFTRLQEITTLYPSLLCTEEEWQATKTISAFGQVGKFVFNYNDDEIVSVRIPAIVNVQGLFDLQNLGMTVEAGLPNITGATAGMQTANQMGDDYGAFYQEYLGSATDQNWGGSGSFNRHVFNTARCSKIYGNSDTVQQEAIQYPYFIQIATGSETEANIVNTLESVKGFTLLENKYSDKPLYNESWLLSNGQYNLKATYPTVYEGLQVEYNAEIEAGTTVTLPDGLSYTKRGLSVKLSTEEYTDYDFVLNTTEEKFRLPTKPRNLNNTRYLIDDGKQNGISYRIYSDGFCEQWGHAYGSGAIVTLLKPYGDTGYHITLGGGNSAGWGNTSHSFTFYNATSNSFQIRMEEGSTLAPGMNCNWLTLGYLAEGEYTPLTDNILLYYYVGNLDQNHSIVNMGRIGEQLATKTDMLQASGAGMPSNKYIDLTPGASGTKYTAPANGWVRAQGVLTANNAGLALQNITTGFGWQIEQSPNGWHPQVILPVSKGDIFSVNTWGNITIQEIKFYYAQGSESEV